MAPVLETPRLLLRLWRESDLDGFAALMAEREAARFLSHDGQPMDRTTAWWHMSLLVGHWSLRGFGLFVVEEKASGDWVGRVGPWRPEGWPGFEIGWALRKPFWGKGYATEAAIAAGAWALARFAPERIIALIHEDNKASHAVARRLNMMPGERMIHAGQPHTVWGVASCEWPSAGEPLARP